MPKGKKRKDGIAEILRSCRQCNSQFIPKRLKKSTDDLESLFAGFAAKLYAQLLADALAEERERILKEEFEPWRAKLVAEEVCGEPAGHFIAGASWFSCVLPKGHEPSAHPDAVEGHLRGGNCFKHGKYVGQRCPEWPNCVPSGYLKGMGTGTGANSLESSPHITCTCRQNDYACIVEFDENCPMHKKQDSQVVINENIHKLAEKWCGWKCSLPKGHQGEHVLCLPFEIPD